MNTTGKAIDDFTERELRAYSWEHVKYELVHVVRGIQFAKAAKQSTSQLHLNFAIEVCLVHLRNLLEFFYPTDRDMEPPDSVFAHNFFHHRSAWTPPEETELLRTCRRRAHKEIAHLTTTRFTEPEDKAWDFDPVMRDLRPVINRFLEDAELIDPRLPGRVRSVHAEL